MSSSYIPPPKSPLPPKKTLFFTIPDTVGSLDGILQGFKALAVNLTRIESRPSRRAGHYDFYVDFAGDVERVVAHLQSVASDVGVVDGDASGYLSAPWFPRKKSDLDSFAEKVLSYGAELDADHPGFKDAEYRRRRDEITTLARTFRHGRALPTIEYTPTEIETWGVVFNKLTTLFPTHACREHQYVFPLLVENCGYRADNIPQLEPVSRFLSECTGFTLRPVMGLLSSRDFLNGLAFRVFHSTQYIRHHSKPFYTPEPDVCHELLGHVPLYADPDFADFSQEIGLASLGASDKDIERLATLYWFTVEFGLCRQGDEVKAFGAGLLSSFGELEYCLSDKPEKRRFSVEEASTFKYPITEFQPVYFVADSFKDMKDKVRDFAATFDRPFEVRYGALTQTIEVLDKKEKLVRYAVSIKNDISRLINALAKLG